MKWLLDVLVSTLSPKDANPGEEEYMDGYHAGRQEVLDQQTQEHLDEAQQTNDQDYEETLREHGHAPYSDGPGGDPHGDI